MLWALFIGLVGEVREAGSRVAVAGAVVRVGDTEDVTDEFGKFDIAGTPVEIVVAALGFETRRVAVTKGERVVVYLRREGDAFETVVMGKRDEPEVSKRVISREEANKLPGSYGDPLRALQNLPGVARPPFVSGQLVIRGAAPQSSRFFVDGMPLPALFHFLLGPSVLPERMIEDMTFLPCCFSARYGGATAGVVDVRPREADVRKVSGKASADLGIASLFIEVPITHTTSITAAARRSYYDAVLPPVLRAINPRYPTVLPAFWDYQARVLHKSDRIGELSLLVFGSDDRLRIVQPPDAQTSTFNPADLNVGLAFHSLQPKWTVRISPAVTHTLTLQGTFGTSSAHTPETRFNQSDWMASGRDELRFKLAPHASLLVGTDVFYDHSSLHARQPQANALVAIDAPYPVFPSPALQAPPILETRRQLATLRWGVYGEAEVKLGAVRLVPGLRVEQNTQNETSKNFVMPRASAHFKVADNVELKAGAGLFQQDINAFHSTAGVQWLITQALSLEVSGFFNALWGAGSGRVYGGEVFLRHKPYKNFFGWVAYTLSRSERNQILFQFDQTHILTLLGSYALPYGFQIGTRFRLVSGNPTTLVTRAVFDSDVGAYLPIHGPENGARLPIFHQLDVRVDKTFVFDTFKLNIYLDVQNVYNQVNAEFAQYSYDYRQRQLFPGLPILPILGLQGEW